MNTPTDHEPAQFWKQQSPINLTRDRSIFVNKPPHRLSFEYPDTPVWGTFQGEEGHKNFELDSCHHYPKRPIVSFGKIRAELFRIHVHSTSEHELEGTRFDGEVHMMHKIIDPQPGQDFLVIGIFVDRGKHSDKSVDTDSSIAESSFFGRWTRHIDSKRNREIDSQLVDLPVKELIKDTSDWYRYEGSLTSRPYTENVSWIVLVNPIGVDSEAYKKLTQNAAQPMRPIQPLNRRFVLRNFR